MDSIVEDKNTLFPSVFEHLNSVENDQVSTSLDEDLLKRAERALDASVPRNLLWNLLNTGERLLLSLQQDPRPLTRVLEVVVSLIPFDELKHSISPAKLEEGLNSPSVPIQLLILTYLRKASDLPSGAAYVASSSTLTQTLFTTWLASESTEVSEQSLLTIELLLAVDAPHASTTVISGSTLNHAEGQGLLWRRVFHDPAVYALLFEWTTLDSEKRDIKTKKGRQLVTISQGRLFDFIARVAPMDWSSITTSSLPEVERPYIRSDAGSEPFGGVLRYAASHMIDNADILMELLRQDFFMKLLGVVEENSVREVTPRMLEAIQQGAGVETTRENSDGGMHL